jgi:heat shock protein 4
MRTQVEDSLSEFLPESEREVFMAKCTEIEDWLYDEDGENAQKSTLKGRLGELTKIGGVAVMREFEFSNREESAAGLKREVGKWEQLAVTEDEKYAHIEAAQRDKVKAACSAADKWLSDALSKQQGRAKDVDPAVTCAEMQAKLTALRKESSAIMDKPKPKPKTPPKPKEEAKKDGKKEEEAPAADADADAAEPEDVTANANDEGEPKVEEVPNDENGEGMEMD